MGPETVQFAGFMVSEAHRSEAIAKQSETCLRYTQPAKEVILMPFDTIENGAGEGKT